MADRTIEFLLVARDQASAAMTRVGSAAQTAGTRSRALGSALGVVAGGAVLGGLAAAGAGLTSLYQGGQEGARVMRVLENQVKNLGPAGRQAFGGASDFAEQLAVQIGGDDDAIREVQAKLASFPDAFRDGSLGAEGMRRATAAAFDLQAIGIGDAQSNIVGIGKALNDPIKGMNALSRAGVSFSAAQKSQITQAMQQGDLAKAQAILMQGIESNAKGAAEAAASNVDKLKSKIGILKGSIEDAVVGGAEKLAGWALTLAPTIGVAFTQIGAAISGVIAWFTKAGSSGQQLGGALSQHFTAMWAVVGPALRGIGQVIQTQVAPAFAAFISAAAPIVAWLTRTLSPVVVAVFGGILTTIKGALSIISGILNIFAGLFTGNWSRMWAGIKQVAGGAWTVIKGLFSASIAALRGILTAAIGALKGIAGRIWQGIKDAFRAAPQALYNIGSDIADGLKRGIQNAAARAIQAARDMASDVTNAVRSFLHISSPSKVFMWLGQMLPEGLGGGILDRTSVAEASAKAMANRVHGAAASALRRLDPLGLDAAVGAPTGGRSAASGRGPLQITVNVTAGAVGSETQLARAVVGALEHAIRSGLLSRDALTRAARA